MSTGRTGRKRPRRDSETLIHVGGFHAVRAALEAVGAAEGPDGGRAPVRTVERVEQVLVDRALAAPSRGGRARPAGGRPSGRARRAGELLALAAAAGVSVREVEEGECDHASGVRSQGIVAAIRYRYADLTDALGCTSGVVVFVDGVEDPHNLGAILRSAAAVGAGAVVIPRHRAAAVTPAVVRASAGTAVLVPVCRVTNLVPAIREARDTGCWVTGLDAAGPRNLAPAGAAHRPALVVGGEGRGLRDLVARSCDEIARLPMAAGVESLNASTAAAVALYRLCETTLFTPG